jgi:DNA-binding CsgD family transcriptional regulator
VANGVERGAMVGREAELAHLERALEAVVDGRGRTIVIGGEAGIGKTKLVETFADRARERGVTVLRGDCLPTGAGTVPYAPFIEAIRRLIRAADQGAIPALLGPGRGELARLIPEIAPSTPTREAPPESDRGGQSRLFEAFLGVLERRSRAGPLVLVVEDIQWADEGTLGVVTFLARTLRETAGLIVLTVRSDDLAAGEPVARWLAELERDPWVERLEIGALDRGEVASLVRSITDDSPASEAIDALVARSGGNPFFIEQLALTTSSAGGRALPARLRDVLAARLAELPPATRIVLRAAATAGRVVDDEVLAVVLGLSPSAIADAIRPALAHGILVDAGGSGDDPRGYTFHHGLLAELAESELVHGERDRLHAAFAAELERRGDVSGVTVAPAELAYHWVAAGDRDRAVPALVDAGLAAERVYAFADARRGFEQALELWPDDGDVETPSGLDRIAVIQHAAESAVLTGAYSEAVALGRQAIMAAELDDAMEGSPDPRRLGALHDRLRWYLWESGDRAAAEQAVAEALRLIPAHPPSHLRARALGQAAGLRLFGGNPADAGTLASEAIDIARSAHAPAEEAFALGILGWSMAVNGDVDGGIETYRQGLAIAERLGGVEGIALGHANQAALLDRVGRTAASLDAAREGFAIAQHLGVVRTYGGVLLGHAAKALFDLGRWDEALAAADDGLALDPRGPSAAWLHINHARVDTNRGSFDQAERHLHDAAGNAAGAERYRPQLLSATAELGAWRGRPDAVWAAVDAALRQLDDSLPLDPALGWLAWHALRVEADAAEDARSRRDQSRLEAIEARIAPIAERLTRSSEPRATRSQDVRRAAVQGLCTGELGRLRGQNDPATWEATAGAWDRIGRPAPAAYARYRAGEALLGSRGDRGRATASLGTAHDAAVKLGAAPLRSEIERLARHGRIDLGTDDADEARGSRDPLGLTEREAEVIRLVAAGRSNQQIADELFITRKTASVHVSNILGKLGVSNRIEAAAIAQRLGIGSEPRD